VGWIETEASSFFDPGLADEPIGSEALEGLELPAEVVGRHEVGQMLLELDMTPDLARRPDPPTFAANALVEPRASFAASSTRAPANISDLDKFLDEIFAAIAEAVADAESIAKRVLSRARSPG
jgi:hypothetical protein